MFKVVNYVMVNVSDMNRSVAFYRDALGIPLKFTSPGWSELDTGATTLALHGAGSPASPSKGQNPAGTASIGFSVENVDETCATLKERGVRFVMPPTDRPQEGIRLAVAVDPDGLPVSFAQSLR
jgi:lactoylglutathione lyase